MQCVRCQVHVLQRDAGNRCNSANNSRKPQKALSKTESRPTSADQQNRTEAHEQGPKQPSTAESPALLEFFSRNIAKGKEASTIRL